MHPLTSYLPKAQSGFLYYPFGSTMQAYSNAEFSYSYGQNGQEKVEELHPDHYTAEYWEYDSRYGRRYNRDIVEKAYESPYAAFANNPIWFVDVNGDDTTVYVNTVTLKKGYVEANKDKGWTDEQMNEQFDAYKKQLFKDMELIYRDNGLNVLVKEVEHPFIMLDKTDQYVEFYYDQTPEHRNTKGYHDYERGKSMINLGYFKSTIKENNTLWVSNTIAHETGHGFIFKVKDYFSFDNGVLSKVLQIEPRSHHHTAGNTNIMSGSGRRYENDDTRMKRIGHNIKSYEQLGKMSKKSEAYREIMPMYKYIDLHKVYFKFVLHSAYLLGH